MNNVTDLADDSDSSDDDYVPNQKDEPVSEVDTDDDLGEGSNAQTSTAKGKKIRRTKTKKKKSLEKNCEEEIVAANSADSLKKELSEEEKKKEIDALWADFVKDSDIKSKNIDNGKEQSKDQKTVKITEVFDFAGEKVKVEKEVKVDATKTNFVSSKDGKNSPGIKAVKRSGGLGNVLGQLSKKKKISTLEKTKLDWDKFKKEENLDEELQSYNKGKDGYLERQDFLERADLRRFEIEKELRSIDRNKRLNNTP